MRLAYIFLFIFYFGTFLGVCTVGARASGEVEDSDFILWLGEFKSMARSQGIRQDVLDRAFAGMRAPRSGSIRADRQQAEFTLTFSDYYRRTVSLKRIRRAQALLEKHRLLFADVYKKYAVPPSYLLAFWGLESNFGDYTGKVSVLHTLATLAYDKRRRDFFSRELISALKILQAGDIAVADMRGSWAGAMGQTQFIPSTFIRYAVDGDGDGRRDLWNSLPDIFYSSANFLHKLGWQAEQDWGYRVALPPDFDYQWADLSTPKPMRFWHYMGVRRYDGEPLPLADETEMTAIILPAGHSGEAFLTRANFNVIMGWNRSVLYALSVGLLSDHIAMALKQPLQFAESPPLATATIKNMQKKLNALGFDLGTPDGIIGVKARQALRAFQIQNNLPADGYPSRATLQALGL